MLKATRSYPRAAGRATGVETSGVERLLPKSQQLEPAQGEPMVLGWALSMSPCGRALGSSRGSYSHPLTSGLGGKGPWKNQVERKRESEPPHASGVSPSQEA